MGFDDLLDLFKKFLLGHCGVHLEVKCSGDSVSLKYLIDESQFQSLVFDKTCEVFQPAAPRHLTLFNDAFHNHYRVLNLAL